MGKFIAGIIVGVVGVAVGAYVYLHYGLINMQADQPVMGVERLYMRGAMDHYAERYAPKRKDPFPPSDEDLIEGIRVYKFNCAVCHGGPIKPISDVGLGLYPKAPQFLQDTPDMPEDQNYWIVKHGVARTGMPAWNKAMSDTDIWKVTTFLSKMGNLDKLSPAVQEAWKTGGQTELQVQQQGAHPAAPAMPRPNEPGHPQHD